MTGTKAFLQNEDDIGVKKFSSIASGAFEARWGIIYTRWPTISPPPALLFEKLLPEILMCAGTQPTASCQTSMRRDYAMLDATRALSRPIPLHIFVSYGQLSVFRSFPCFFSRRLQRSCQIWSNHRYVVRKASYRLEEFAK